MRKTGIMFRQLSSMHVNNKLLNAAVIKIALFLSYFFVKAHFREFVYALIDACINRNGY